MGHRKWMLFGVGAESMEGAVREHNALYDAWDEVMNWRAQCLDENNRLDRELDEARKRIAELEAPTRVPFSDAHIERMAKAAYTARMRREEKSRCWDEIPLMSKDAWRQGIRAALAAGGLEPCAVPEYEPDDVALPAGVPSVEELVAVGDKAYNTCSGPYQEAQEARATAILTALRPWLRDPVGWELDVHPDQLELYKWVTEPDGGYAYAAQQAIDLCRSRIRPVYECKECAAWKAKYNESNQEINKALEAFGTAMPALSAARAALEGE